MTELRCRRRAPEAFSGKVVAGFPEKVRSSIESGTGDASVANKVPWGTFPATFFLAALKAIGCEQVALEDI
jgi:uncharacterized protein DUF6471